MTRRGSVVLVVFLSWSGTAAAADNVVVAPSAPNPARFANARDFNWSGMRLGLHGGWAWSNYGALDGDGGFGGVHAGYDRHIGRGVVGVEASVKAGDIQLAPGTTLDTVVDVRARLGFAMDRVLVYGTAGGAYGSAGDGLDDTGWTAGAGVDFAPTERTILGMEWIRYRFNDFAGTGNTLEFDLVEGKITYKF